MREWLSGGVSPCQGEGRGFESRLALFFLNGGVLFYAVSAVFIFCIFTDSFKNLCPCAYSFHPQSGNCIYCLTPL